VLIVAALPDPAGTDRGHEVVTLLNTTVASIDLTGWGLVDAAGGRQNLSGPIAGGGWCRSPPPERSSSATQGDTLVPVNLSGASIDQPVRRVHPPENGTMPVNRPNRARPMWFHG
jgi:hypothetical protein